MKFHELLSYDPSLTLCHPSHFDGDIEGLAHIDSPRPDHVVFVKDNSYLDKLSPDQVDHVGVVLRKDLWQKQEFLCRAAFVAACDDVLFCLASLSAPFYKKEEKRRQEMVDGRQMNTAKIHPTAWIAQGVFISEDVSIEENVKIHPGVVVGSGCKIGKNTTLFPNVVLYHNVIIGEGCRIHGGCIIGSDGFGHYFKEGIHYKIWHLGGVEIDDDVEIGANTTIDGGTLSKTFIGKGCKIDNGVQIGHNCRLGQHIIICGHVAIAGSVTIGDNCVFGGAAGVKDNTRLGKNCQIGARSAVLKDWPDGSVVGGFPARDKKEWLKGIAYLRKKSL